MAGVLVLSPHRDDAAFSCGLILATLVRARVRSRIANVCTISDYAPYANVMDGSDTIREITRLRAEEDAAFVQHLHGECEAGHRCLRLLDLGWKDSPLRLAISTEKVLDDRVISEDEVARLAATFRLLGPVSVVLAPMALGGHVDHRLVRDAAIRAWRKDELVFYEDLPYVSRIAPSEREEQKQRALPWPCRHWQTPPARSGAKRRLALCYPSQIAPNVADEMEEYSAALGWTECLYGTKAALQILQTLPVEQKPDEQTGLAS